LQAPGQVPARTAAALAHVIRGWIAQPLETLHAAGAAERQLAVTLVFEGGATALVGVGPSRAPGAGVDITVLGNHGALYHDAGSANPWDEAAEVPADQVDETVADAISRSLESGRPERLTARA
jgi:hypothetical protein